MNHLMRPSHANLRSSLAVIVCVFFSPLALSQDDKAPTLHSPAEIYKILEASTLMYEISDEYVPVPADSPVVLSNQMFLRETDHGYTLEYLTLTEVAQPLFDKAEAAFHAGKHTEAIEGYRHLLEVQPGFIFAITLIGDAYYAADQFDSARANFLMGV